MGGRVRCGVVVRYPMFPSLVAMELWALHLWLNGVGIAYALWRGRGGVVLRHAMRVNVDTVHVEAKGSADYRPP